MLKICVLYNVFKLYGLFSCTCNLVCGVYGFERDDCPLSVAVCDKF